MSFRQAPTNVRPKPGSATLLIVIEEASRESHVETAHSVYDYSEDVKIQEPMGQAVRLTQVIMASQAKQ